MQRLAPVGVRSDVGGTPGAIHSNPFILQMVTKGGGDITWDWKGSFLVPSFPSSLRVTLLVASHPPGTASPGQSVHSPASFLEEPVLGGLA